MKSQKQIRKLRQEIRSAVSVGCCCWPCIIKLNELILLDVILGDNSPKKYFKALYDESGNKLKRACRKRKK
jgi:hypothetical protein